MIIWGIVGLITEIVLAAILPSGEYYNRFAVRLNWSFYVLLLPILAVGIGYTFTLAHIIAFGVGAALAAVPVLSAYLAD